ncbi:protein phosphatase 1 regulatory subunit 15B [Antennarius striatus]|uniref:protein phosphatase 1 regulatory subunit 15B n=1 Tax=Antennarius striatus TaxID=241820 RepID=UPI0035AFBA23
MATTVGAAEAPERTAMERFGTGGLALLPWTRQMLTVLWEQFRLLMSVIYYTFMSVFQMFRFEVHVRITDDIQHMGAAANPTESFLFSSLFDGENAVMVGGSNPLSNFCGEVGDPFAGKSTAEALLSSLRADDLCCGLVDDFVSRTTGSEDGIFRGHHSSWKMGFPGDWNIFVSSGEAASSDDSCHRGGEKVFKQDASEEDRSSSWSSEEDQNLAEFDSEESKALWESLSRSSDPYNPFFFSACISTNANMGKSEREAADDVDDVSVTKVGEAPGPPGLNFWVSRSDSENSWSSWAGSDGSAPDVDEDNERLLELFSSADPYNPLCFTASRGSGAAERPTSTLRAPLPVAEEEEVSPQPSSEEDDEEEEQLWKSLCSTDDPYHPLNFKACLQTSAPPRCEEHPDATDVDGAKNSQKKYQKCQKEARTPKMSQVTKPPLQDRHSTKPPLQERCVKSHAHPEMTQVPWIRPGRTPKTPPQGDGTAAPKKVRFSPLVHVHVMRSWTFAQQASRKGPWEEMARDRDRFRRRIQAAERAIGYCLAPSHRESARMYADGSSKRQEVPDAER